MPDHVGLRIAVQQQQRCPLAARPHDRVDVHAAAYRDRLVPESGKEVHRPYRSPDAAAGESIARNSLFTTLP